MIEIPKDINLSILNIGTAVLVRDVMDQHLRSLGDIRTYYASNLRFALQTYSERHIDLIFCEFSFPNGTAEEFIRKIGGIDATDNLYFTISSGQNIRHVRALAHELNVDSVMEEPFSTNDIIERVRKAIEKRNRDRNLWIDQLLEAKLAAKNMRQNEAKTLFRELLNSNAGNEAVLYEAAQFYLQLPDFDAARNAIAAIMTINPGDSRAKSLFASLAIKQGEFSDALRIFEDLQRASPLNMGRANEIATTYMAMALKQARSAQDISETNIESISTSIKCLAALRRYPEVVAMFERYKDKFHEEERREIELYTSLSKKLGNII